MKLSIKAFLYFTFLTGIFFPVIVTIMAQIIFPHQANGSLVVANHQVVGSELIGQDFDSSIYFFSRPSTSYYNGLNSGGSNICLTSSKLIDLVNKRKNNFVRNNLLDSLNNVPSDMLYASGSGLDPHISVSSALLQINRIVKARGLSINKKNELLSCISRIVEKPQFLCLGSERINVLDLNLELDKLDKK